MFPFSFFILDPSLSLLASLLLPLPSDFDYHHSFQPHACCRTLTHNTLTSFNLNTRSFSHMTLCTLLPAGHFFQLRLYLSPPLSLHSIHYIAADSDHINTLHWPCQKAGKLAHCSPFICVHFWVTAALSPSCFCRSLCLLILLVRPI